MPKKKDKNIIKVKRETWIAQQWDEVIKRKKKEVKEKSDGTK